MKREREAALEEAVEEIVDRAKAKGEDGEPLYPVMQEPLVIVMFHAGDALLEILKNKPLRLLNLLQTNKALNTFWEQFRGIWIILLDRFVEMEMDSTYLSEIYPFFVVKNHIDFEEGKELYAMPPYRWHKDPEQFMQGYSGYRRETFAAKMLVSPYVKGSVYRCVKPDLPYSIVYYEPLTQQYMAILRRVERLLTVLEIDDKEIIDNLVYNYLGQYPRMLICYDDCFLIQATQLFYPPFKYKLDEMDAGLLILTESLIYLRDRVIDHDTEVVEDAYNELIVLVSALGVILEDRGALTVNVPTPVLLDKESARAYRMLLFDNETGLYNTPEKQKEFFLLTLNFMHKWSASTNMKDYGSVTST